MVEASVIVSVVIAAISLLSSLAVAVIGNSATRKEGKRRGDLEKQLQVQQSQLDEEVRKREKKSQSDEEVAALVARYSSPLMLAAYELQARLYELLEYPISKEHLETVEGLEDIKIFTCYRFAQFLAWTYILESKTQYFSFTNDPKLMLIGDLILRLNEEFDRRRNRDGDNIGVWPGSRLLVSARMIRDDMKEKDVPLDMIVKTYDVFRSEWDLKFKGPMSYFCHWIDRLVQGRMERRDHLDDALRCTQHNLVALVKTLDTKDSINQSLRCKPLEALSYFCDCGVCRWPHKQEKLEYRKESRNNDIGIEAPWKYEKVDTAYKESIDMERFNSYTDTERFNPWLYGRPIRRDSTGSASAESDLE